MRAVVLLLLCLAAVALAQNTYGSAPTTVTLKNSTAYSAGAAGVSSFLTAEDRRFTVALNWLRQDPATWKNFMKSQGRWIIKEPFLVVNSQLQPNYALHYNPNIAAASAYHTYEMAVNSPTNSIAYDFSIHCPEPKKYPGTPCSPPMQYKATPNSVPVNVECFRREGCTDPTIDYYDRMDIFNTPIVPAPGSKIAGGNFYAGGDAYTNDLERGVSAAMAIACDSPFPDLPYNCTADTFGGDLDTGKEILYKPIGLRIHGAAYYAATSKKVNYFDTYFAAGPAPSTENPIASAGFLTVNGNGYFVANYREPSKDTGVPNQIGVVYQIGTSGVANSSLSLSATSALVFTKNMAGAIFTACNASQSVVYAFYAVDSNGVTYRYPENSNLNACAGFGPSDGDIVAEPTPGPLVANGAIVFLGISQTPPPGSNPANKPTVPFGGSSFAVATLPALALIFAALLAVLAL